MLARVRRAVAERRRRQRAELRRRCRGCPSPSETCCAPPPVWKRTNGPLPSKFAPSAGEPDHRVGEVLVVLAARRGTRRGSRRRPWAGARRARISRRRSVSGSSCSAASVNCARSRVSGARSVTRPCSSASRHQRRRLRDPREGRVDRRGRLADAGQDLAREGARRRERGVERVERARWPPRASAASSRIDACRLPLSEASARHRHVEVGDEVLELDLVAGEAGAGAGEPAHEAAEVLLGLRAEQRLVDLGLRLLGRADVLVGVVEGLGRRLAARGRVGLRVVLPAVGSSLSAEPRPSITSCRSWRVSDCSAVSTWSSWTGVAVWVTVSIPPSSSSSRAGRARLEVDEEVALEEDARADLRRRVACRSAGPRRRSPS